MFALAVPTQKIDVADAEEIVLDLTGPASYTNPGGEDFAPGDLPLRVGLKVDSVEGRAQSGDFWLLHDKASDKLRVFVSATGVEVANAVDLSAEVFTTRILGR